MNVDKKFDKAYHSMSPAQLVEAPVSALHGLSEGDAELLKEAFNVNTVGDLAALKYAQWAREICELADSGEKAEMAAFKHKLDKKYEKKTPKMIAKSPVDALQGLSKKDAQRLAKAFNVKTVRDLASLKYIEWARETVRDAAEFTSSRSGKMMKRPYMKKAVILFFILLALAIIIVSWPSIKRAFHHQAATPADEIKSIPPYGPAQITGDKADAKKAPGKAEAPKTAAPAGQEGWLYTVERGDTLASIAEKLEGRMKAQQIYEANKDQIRNASLIFPGQKLKLPHQQKAKK